jgi:hypothetical protein
MTSEENLNNHCEKSVRTLEEICDNTRAIRRVVNRILDHLHEYGSSQKEDLDDDAYDPDAISWKDLDNNDDMYL